MSRMRCSVSAKRERCTAGPGPPRAMSCGVRGFVRFQGLIPLAVPVQQRTASLRSALRCARDTIQF